MNEPEFVPLNQYCEYAPDVMQQRAIDFYQDLMRRRTVREYSEKPIPKDVIEYCLKAAGTAPSGANQQPWHFVAVSDPVIKHRIREAAEKEERAFYEHRAPDAWLNALSHLGTHAQKPFLMDFLNKILKRPSNEKAFMILVTGYPKKDVTVPNISKKSFEEIATII